MEKESEITRYVNRTIVQIEDESERIEIIGKYIWLKLKTTEWWRADATERTRTTCSKRKCQIHQKIAQKCPEKDVRVLLMFGDASHSIPYYVYEWNELSGRADDCIRNVYQT